MFNVIEKGDSIKDPITKKYDIILANPPFGIDGLNYNEISDSLRNEYLPIKLIIIQLCKNWIFHNRRKSTPKQTL